MAEPHQQVKLVGDSDKAASRLLRYGLAVLATALALALTRLLWPVLEETPLPFFFVAVLASAWYGGTGPGLFSAALATLAADYLLVGQHEPPVSWGSAVRLGVFALVSSLTSGLGAARRREREARAEAERQKAAVEELNAELERRVLGRTAELQAANKELESFSYSVSHDLRSPLRSIDGFSKALLEDYSDRLDDEGVGYLRRVRAASQRMGQLIDDLLKLSRITRSEMSREQVDLSAAARAVVGELRKAQPGRRVTCRIAEGVTADGDGRLLRVALENLLSNAWKFTANRQDALIEFGATERDGRPVYFVRDNGAGFDMAYAGKLFGAFQRLHAMTEFEGTGIGLSIVQRVVRRHGGDVWAEAAVGEGATFFFTLDGKGDGA